MVYEVEGCDFYFVLNHRLCPAACRPVMQRRIVAVTRSTRSSCGAAASGAPDSTKKIRLTACGPAAPGHAAPGPGAPGPGRELDARRRSLETRPARDPSRRSQRHLRRGPPAFEASSWLPPSARCNQVTATLVPIDVPVKTGKGSSPGDCWKARRGVPASGQQSRSHVARRAVTTRRPSARESPRHAHAGGCDCFRCFQDCFRCALSPGGREALCMASIDRGGLAGGPLAAPTRSPSRGAGRGPEPEFMDTGQRIRPGTRARVSCRGGTP